MALVQGPRGVVAAWDTDEQIYFATLEPGTAAFTEPQPAPGAGRGRKHPALAFNTRGEMLLAWTEGTGWERGGALVWQVFDEAGKPSEQQGRVERGIPVWGLPTAVATNKGFVILH